MQDLWFDKITNHDKTSINSYQLPDKFLLYPASTWAHKNHLGLLEAIKKLNNPDIKLICTGHPTEHYEKNILPYIESEKLFQQVKFLGIVTDEVLFELYHKCRAVVVPTLYEAGSFPLIESILMGIPVICSKVTSLPDTIGNERFTFDPLNVLDISNKIEKIYFDLDYREENIAQLKIQRKKLINTNAAAKFEHIYKTICN